MTWESFYLLCFLVGFLLSLVSFLGQMLHFGGHTHTGHVHAHGGHVHAHGGHVHAHGGHVHAHGTASTVSSAELEISKFNFMTITAFLAWFGGTGYLLSRYSGVWVWLGFMLASAVGLVGAGIVFVVLGKLLAREHNLNPADYDMIGVLGHVSSTIRPNGVGEIVFSQEGVRKATAVRSENGREIDKGVEVVVTRFEKGIAYVRRWDEFSGESVAAMN
jgi:membrane protein implicated in regulation of membrane protease activity